MDPDARAVPGGRRAKREDNGARRPNFFVVGAHKAGTTSFCELIAAHPDVFVSSPKEPAFFAHARYRARGLLWYEGLFASACGIRAIGEGSTLYSQSGVYPGAALRIKAYAPQARIFYLVRHPLRRIESAWVQYRGQGRADVSTNFADAVRRSPQLLDASRYLIQLDEYRRCFARIQVVFFEQFVTDPLGVLRDAYAFLGVDPTFQPLDPHRPRNPSAGKRELRPPIRTLARLPGGHKLRPIKRLSKTRLGSGTIGSVVLSTVTTRPIERPVFDPGTREWVIGEIGSETEQFLLNQGKSTSTWSLD